MTVPDTIEVRKRTTHVGAKIASGDLADIHVAYSAAYPAGSDQKIVLKIGRDRKDNDLLENEARILNYLYPSTQKDEKFYRYLPRLLDTARLPDKRHVSIFPLMEGYVSCQDILAAYPQGIDFRDMVWMYKRLLSGIGFAHEMGVVHGAILPPHVLVHPTGHGAKIIDWSYALNFAALVTPSVVDPKAGKPTPTKKPSLDVWAMLRQNLYEEDDPTPIIVGVAPQDPKKMYVKAISVAYQGFYAPEILKKENPSPATDIYMAAKLAVALLGGDVSTNQLPVDITRDGTFPEPERARTQLQAFLQVSLLPAQRKRPQDAWQVLEDFDKLLLNLVGTPTYRPFTMPSKGAPS